MSDELKEFGANTKGTGESLAAKNLNINPPTSNLLNPLLAAMLHNTPPTIIKVNLKSKLTKRHCNDCGKPLPRNRCDARKTSFCRSCSSRKLMAAIHKRRIKQ